MPTGSNFDFGASAQNTVPNTSQEVLAPGAAEQVTAPGADEATMSPADRARAQSAGKKRRRKGGRRRRREEGHAVVHVDDSISKLQESEKKTLRRKVGGVGGALLVLCLVSLCVDPKGGFISPIEVLACYKLWFTQTFGSLIGSTSVLTPTEIFDVHEPYYRVMDRVGVTGITVFAGVLLAVAGTLYQNVFRNPIASPSMLGVSSGINLGNVLLVLFYGAAAAELVGVRYLLCYASVIVVLILLVTCSKLISGKGRPLNIVNMLLVGTILSQLVGVVVNYITWYLIDDEVWETYNAINEALTVDTSWLSIVLIGVAFAAAIIPVYLLRFRFNVLSMSDEDMRMLGVDSNKLQVIAMICGTVMMLTAQMHTGTVAMISLVVPHVSRYLFGAEFGKQFWGNILLGAAVLVFCRCVVSFIPFVGGGLPIGTVVSFVVMPVFVWMIATQQRSWE